MDSTLLGPIPWMQRGDGIVSTSSDRMGQLSDQVLRAMPRVLAAGYRNREGLPFSTGFPGRRLAGHPAVRSADVIHIHWVAQGPVSIRAIGRLGRPTVWTLRDMWAFTGGCHVTLGCDRYHDRCGACPQLGSARERDLSRLVWSLKRRWYSDSVTIVGPSRWISDCARQSSLLGGHDVRTIPNCVDTDTFFPVPRAAARQVLGLPAEGKVVLAGSENLGDRWKGTDLLIQALRDEALAGTPFTLVLFGLGAAELRGTGAEVRHLGYLADDATLRAAYSAADVFVAPYRQDAFGKTLVEALCCGTPVVAFDATGPGDIVRHGRTGYLAQPFEAEDLAAGIARALGGRDGEGVRDACRADASERFGMEPVAARYLDLYEELVSYGRSA